MCTVNSVVMKLTEIKVWLIGQGIFQDFIQDGANFKRGQIQIWGGGGTTPYYCVYVNKMVDFVRYKLVVNDMHVVEDICFSSEQGVVPFQKLLSNCLVIELLFH